MAAEEMIRAITLVANADLRGDMYKLGRSVRRADGTAGVVRAIPGDRVSCVLYGKANEGEAMRCAVSGKAKVISGGTFQADDEVGVDANGLAVKLAAGGSGAQRVGIAMEDAVPGQVFQVWLTLLGGAG